MGIEAFKSRDFSVPLTEAEVEEVGVFLRSLPTYDKDGDYFLTEDIPAFLTGISYTHTPEQRLAYKDFWDTNFEGKLPLKETLRVMATLHHSRPLALEIVTFYDKDGDGFISAADFAHLLKSMVAHDPSLTVSFEEFVKVANVNAEGKVSLDECSKWIQTNFPESQLKKDEME